MVMKAMAEQTPLTLWGAGTTRTLRPIWVAEELGLKYEHVALGPRTGETQTPQFTRLNPKQKIPYLVDGPVRLSESVAISRYLIARYGNEATINSPGCLESRAKEDEWVCYIYGELDETSLYVMRRHGELKEIFGEAPQAVDAARAYASRQLSVVANHLEGRDYVLGDRFGLSDVLLVSCLDWANHYGFELADSLVRYREAMTQRIAYQRAVFANYANKQ